MNKITDYRNRITELIEIADKVIATQRQSDFITFVDSGLFATFRSASLSFLKNVYGDSHPYYTDFINRCRESRHSQVITGKGILISVKHEIDNGWLFTLKSLITSEIFSDFLEMAKYLLEEKYKDPAAVMIGSVLEEHLRQLCIKNLIPIELLKDNKPQAKKADLLNSDLARKNVYNKLEQKNITAWLDLRNKAAHGKYSEYSHQQVEIMYLGVLDFISRNIV